jgi:hypothetical protein
VWTLVTKERTKNKGSADQNQNAGPPIAFTAEKHEGKQNQPEHAAETPTSVKVPWSRTKVFMLMHLKSFLYA